MANGRLGRDVQHLRRHVRADFEGQVCVTEVGDNLDFISLDVAPNSGPYKGARLNFRVFLKGYPEDVPQVVCLNGIYHPNIDPVMDGDENGGYAVSNVCVSLLDEWTSTMSLDHVVMAVLFLLNYPQLDDILSPLMGVMSAEEFHENVRRSLRGQEVDGYRYPCLIVDDANAEEDIGYQKTNTCISDKVVYKNANTSKMARFISTDDSTNTLTEGVTDEFCDEKDRSDEIDSQCTMTCTLEAKREKMYLLTAPNKWTVCYQAAQKLLKVLLFLCQKLS